MLPPELGGEDVRDEGDFQRGGHDVEEEGGEDEVDGAGLVLGLSWVWFGLVKRMDGWMDGWRVPVLYHRC